MAMSDFQLPIPRDWQKFERLCYFAYKAEWDSNDIKMHGRLGQAQYGVDVFGTRKSDKKFLGIQCKGKDNNFGIAPDIDEVISELKKAEEFLPKLDAYIFATTATRDAKLQRQVSELSRARESENQFSVEIIFWEDIELILQAHPSVTRFLYSEFIQSLSGTVGSTFGPPSITLALDEDETSRLNDPIVSSQLDEARNCLQQYRPHDALQILNAIEVSIGHIKSGHTKFRLFTNLGAAYQLLEQFDKSAKYFHQAFQFSQNDVAISNLALAAIFEGDESKALQISSERVAQGGQIPEAILSTYAAYAAFEVISSSDVLKDEAVKSYSLARTLSARYRNEGQYGPAREVLKAVTKTPDDVITEGLRLIDLGTLDLSEFVETDKPAVILEPSLRGKRNLLQIANKFREGLRQLPETALQEQRSTAYLNLGTIERYLGDFESANESFDKAIAIKKKAEAYKSKIMLLIEANKVDDAKKYFKENSDYLASESIEIYLSVLGIFASIPGAIPNLGEEVDRLTKQLSPDGLLMFALQYVENSRNAAEQAIIETKIKPSLDKHYVGASEWLLFLARLYKEDQPEIESLPTFPTTLEALLPLLPILLAVISRLMRVGAYPTAYRYADTLYKQAPTHFGYSLLIQSAYKLGNGPAVQNLIAQADIESLDRRTASAIVEMQINFGDLISAKNNLDKLMEAGLIDEFIYWSRVANIGLRRNDSAVTDEAINHLKQIPPKSFSELRTIVQILNTEGRGAESIRLLFQYRPLFLDQLEYHAMYMVTCLMSEGESLVLKDVQPGVGVNIKIDGGESRLVYLGNSEQLRDYAIDESSEIYGALVGRKIGETVMLRGPVSRAVQIEAIYTSQQIAFLDSRKRVEVGGWDKTHIAYINLGDIVKLPSGQSVPQNLYEQLDKRRAHVEQMFALLDANQITYNLFAEAVGIDLYDLFSSLFRSGRGIRNAAAKFLDSRRDIECLVWSLSSVTILTEIGRFKECLDLLASQSVRSILPRHILDFFIIKYKQSQQDIRRAQGFASTQAGGLHFEQYTEEQLLKKTEDLKKLIATLNEVCEVLPAPILPGELAQDSQLIEALGVEESAAIILAREKKWLLVMDDTLASIIVDRDFNGDVCNVPWLYEWLEGHGVIGREDQARVSLSLLMGNANGINISGELIWQSLLEGLLRGDIYLVRALNLLRGFSSADRGLQYAIYLDFITKLWRSSREKEFKREYTIISLRLVFDGPVDVARQTSIFDALRKIFHLEPFSGDEVIALFRRHFQSLLVH